MEFLFLDSWSRLIVKFGDFTYKCFPRVILDGEDYGLKVSINDKAHLPL
jgi:hypothetical protein